MLASGTVRYVANRSPPSSLSRARSPKTPWSRWWWSTNRSRSSLIQSKREPMRTCSSRRWDEHLLLTRLRWRRDALRRLRGRGRTDTGQSACRTMPTRGSLRGRSYERGRTPGIQLIDTGPHGVRDALATFLDLEPDQVQRRDTRRRWRIRREGRGLPRRHRRGMVCAEARPSGALDRDAFGEHARIGSRARPGPARTNRRDARGCRTGLSHRSAARHWRVRRFLVRCFRS